MLVKPNELYSGNEHDYANDLYRKFNDIFTEILHPDDSSYEMETYCETKGNITENNINGVLKNMSDSIVPVLGYTGMGKTFLMHYCLRKRFNIEGLIKNKSFIVNDDRGASVVIYASYDANKVDSLKSGRLAGKLAAASNEILKAIGLDNDTKEGKRYISSEVAKYIRENKAELLEENAPSTDSLDIEKAENLYRENQLAYEQEKLKWLLTHKATNIKSVIVVLDDIEGQANLGTQNVLEYELINTYLKMYDCLRRCEGDERHYKVKLFLCMRERTYNEVKKSAWYNTHRINTEPIILSSGIKLGDIFMKRFSALEKKMGIFEEVTKKEIWGEAKRVLEKLSNELEENLGNDILELCNYNVCDALQLFAGILGNRQWTQKNERMQASFKIEEYQYYLSTASCYKAIAMKNRIVYNNTTHLSNIFYSNDKVGYCLPIYILMMLNERGDKSKELSLKQIQDNIIGVMKYDPELKKIKLEQIEEIVRYYAERDMIFEKVVMIGEREVDYRYYVTPKGKVILSRFFESTILLEIFRDDIYLDNSNHDVSCSTNLSREDLFFDIIKLINEIGVEEKGMWDTSVIKETESEYYRLWRNERITLMLIEALRKSLNKYYKKEIPNSLLEGLEKLKSDFSSLAKTIQC